MFQDPPESFRPEFPHYFLYFPHTLFVSHMYLASTAGKCPIALCLKAVFTSLELCYTLLLNINYSFQGTSLLKIIFSQCNLAIIEGRVKRSSLAFSTQLLTFS